MSVRAKSPLRLEIGHVLFIDIVGYSTLLINEQSDLLAELNDVVRGTEHFCSAETEGKLVRSTHHGTRYAKIPASRR